MSKRVIIYVLCFWSLILPRFSAAHRAHVQALDSLKQLSFEAVHDWEVQLSEADRLAHVDSIAAFYLQTIQEQIDAGEAFDQSYGAFFQLTSRRACGLFIHGTERFLLYFDDRGLLTIYDYLRHCYIQLGNVSMSFHYGRRLFELNRKLGRFKDWMTEEHGSRSIYYDLKMYPQALESAKRVLPDFIKNEGESASLYNNLALFFQKAGELDSALFYYKKALLTWDKDVVERDSIGTYDLFFKGLIKGNIASCYQEQGKYKLAISYYRQDIAANHLNFDLGSKLNSFCSLTETYLAISDFRQAQAAYDSTQYLLQRSYSFHIAMRLMLVEAALAAQQGQHAVADRLRLRYIAIQDSIAQKEKNDRSRNLMVLYENDLQSQQIERQAADIRDKELSLVQQRQRLTTIVSALAMVLLVTAAMIWGFYLQAARRREVEAKNREIALQKEEIHQQLKEKEVLIREVHHRVKNNLQLVSGLLDLQIGHFQDEEVQAGITLVKHRVKSMAILHEKLYASENLAEIPFSSYVEDLINHLHMINKPSFPKVNIFHQVDEAYFSIDQLIPLGLIINELVTNAYKHAFPNPLVKGHILVHLNKLGNDGTYQLHISDDGVGSTTFQSKSTNSLGMILVEGLARQLGGSFQSEWDHGAHFTITFKQT